MKRILLRAGWAAVALAFGSCGGGGGEGGGNAPAAPEVGVFTGFSGNLDWESTGGGEGGVGAGATGDGGVGAGGDFGQFRGATVRVYLQDGTLLGSAVTDNDKGMVTIRPGATYQGMLRIELSGNASATYYEEGKGEYVPFPADRTIRVWVPAIQRNIGITPFTEAAYRLLTEGSTSERASGAPTADQVRAANERVRGILNQQFPSLLAVDDITRLPYIKSPALPAGSISTDPRGRYGLVNGAFSKQAALFNSGRSAPTLDLTRQLAEDLLDGQLDGRNGSAPAAPVAERTYEPNTLTGELSSALAEQATRFGSQQAIDVLPRVLNFGSTRYQGYLFDGSISKDGKAYSTVAGWVADNALGRTLGQALEKLPSVPRTAVFIGNFGHGGAYFKTDEANSVSRVYALGDNVNGELGLGHKDSTGGAAVAITLPGVLTHAAGGFAHTVARMADGSVYAWGDNSYGQLGLGQDPSALPGATTPQRVTLPAGALAVAATNLASYALLEDGTVWAWGSSGGFALLGNGSADGIATAPVQVAGLSDVVQISARDNDVMVLRRDNTIWHWGSYPAPENAYTAGDMTTPYAGGSLLPTQAVGLPAGVAVRKVLTEQGLFAALLANGQVWTWGVYFDLTAGTILRDLTPVRVLGLPPLRDMMPGGFIGYGARPFDRLTAMGVDYRGGMWKVRGRVAEAYDPDNPSAQHRPQGQAPRPDCIGCHTYLDQSLAELKALAPSTTGTAACVPPATVHMSGTASLIHAETECVQCHNPARLAYGALTPAFVASGGWPDCSKPADLPPRTSTTPALLTEACTVPPTHVYTPPGTVCATCHNSVIARPLQDLQPPCAQPKSSALPSIQTTAAISGAFDDGGRAIVAGSVTSDRTPELRGALSAALASGQSLAVLRNGAVVGNATVNGTGWSYTDNASDGSVSYSVRVVASSGFGRDSVALAFAIDATPPAAVATITGFGDDQLGNVAPAGFASDTTPTVYGTLSAPLGSGETLQVLRGGAVVGNATVNGNTWSWTEPAALAGGTYAWQARAIDAAGNTGAFGNGAALTIVTSLPAAAITQIVNDANVVVPAGGGTSDNTPTLRGTLGGALAAGQTVAVLRDGTAIGSGSVSGTTWTFTDPGAADGSHTYAARVQAGQVLGAPSSYVIVVDTVAPTQTASITLADDFIGPLANGATTADTTPRVDGVLSAPLAAGEQVRVLRGGSIVATLTPSGTGWSYTEPAALASGSYSYTAQVVDIAGLLGPVSAARSVTVDANALPLQNAAATLATINGNTPASGQIGPNNVDRPVLAGTVQRALATGEVLAIYRGTSAGSMTAVGSITFSGTSWSYQSASLADGTYYFKVRIEQAANSAVFGAFSATVATPIDRTAPLQTAAVAQVYDNSGSQLVAVGGSFSSDNTPRIDGTLSAALGAGEQVRLYRGSTAIATFAAAGTSWSYVDGALGDGSYTYRAEVVDAAGNVGPTNGASVSVSVVTSLPAATITAIRVSGSGSFGKPDGTLVTSGNAIPDTTPTLSLGISPALPAGYEVRVYRAAAVAPGSPILIGSASGCGTSCTFTDPGASEMGVIYTARAAAGSVLGTASAPYAVTIDVTPPSAPSLAAYADNYPFQNLPALTSGRVQISPSGSTGDPDPQIEATFGALVSGETVQLLRQGSVVAATTTAGATTLNITHPTVLSRPTSSPSPTGSTAVDYTVRRIDAAGNANESTLSFTIAYQLCNAERAKSFSTNGTHTNVAFPGGGLTCVSSGCHTQGTTVDSIRYVAAPRSNPGANNWYWCRRE